MPSILKRTWKRKMTHVKTSSSDMRRGSKYQASMLLSSLTRSSCDSSGGSLSIKSTTRSHEGRRSVLLDSAALEQAEGLRMHRRQQHGMLRADPR